LEHIRVEHPRPFLLKNEHKKRICILDWDGSKLIASSTLGSKPWSLRSGDHIFYKDNREKEKYSKDDFAENIMLKMEFEEQPLIIYDPLEQMLREEEENKKLTEQKEKFDTAQQDAILRMQDNAHASAAKAQTIIQKSLANQ